MSSSSPGGGSPSRPGSSRSSPGPPALKREDWLYLETQIELMDWTKPQPGENTVKTGERRKKVKGLAMKVLLYLEERMECFGGMKRTLEKMDSSMRESCHGEMVKMRDEVQKTWNLLSKLAEKGGGDPAFGNCVKVRLAKAKAAQPRPAAQAKPVPQLPCQTMRSDRLAGAAQAAQSEPQSPCQSKQTGKFAKAMDAQPLAAAGVKSVPHSSCQAMQADRSVRAGGAQPLAASQAKTDPRSPCRTMQTDSPPKVGAAQPVSATKPKLEPQPPRQTVHAVCADNSLQNCAVKPTTQANVQQQPAEVTSMPMDKTKHKEVFQGKASRDPSPGTLSADRAGDRDNLRMVPVVLLPRLDTNSEAKTFLKDTYLEVPVVSHEVVASGQGNLVAAGEQCRPCTRLAATAAAQTAGNKLKVACKMEPGAGACSMDNGGAQSGRFAAKLCLGSGQKAAIGQEESDEEEPAKTRGLERKVSSRQEVMCLGPEVMESRPEVTHKKPEVTRKTPEVTSGRLEEAINKLETDQTIFGMESNSIRISSSTELDTLEMMEVQMGKGLCLDGGLGENLSLGWGESEMGPLQVDCPALDFLKQQVVVGKQGHAGKVGGPVGDQGVVPELAVGPVGEDVGETDGPEWQLVGKRMGVSRSKAGQEGYSPPGVYLGIPQLGGALSVLGDGGSPVPVAKSHGLGLVGVSVRSEGGMVGPGEGTSSAPKAGRSFASVVGAQVGPGLGGNQQGTWGPGHPSGDASSGAGAWQRGSGGPERRRRNVVQLLYTGKERGPTRGEVINMVLDLGFRVGDLFAVIHPPNSAEYDVSFVTPVLMELFVTKYEPVKGVGRWKEFRVTVVSRQEEVKNVTILVRNESLPPEDIMTWLSRFGQLAGPIRKNLDERGIWTGAWSGRIKLGRRGYSVSHIPASTFIGRDRILVFYPGQPRLCFKCGSPSHLSRDCIVPRCVRCGALGHMADSCSLIRCNLCGEMGHPFSRCPRAYRGGTERDGEGEGGGVDGGPLSEEVREEGPRSRAQAGAGDRGQVRGGGGSMDESGVGGPEQESLGPSVRKKQLARQVRRSERRAAALGGVSTGLRAQVAQEGEVAGVSALGVGLVDGPQGALSHVPPQGAEDDGDDIFSFLSFTVPSVPTVLVGDPPDPVGDDGVGQLEVVQMEVGREEAKRKREEVVRELSGPSGEEGGQDSGLSLTAGKKKKKKRNRQATVKSVDDALVCFSSLSEGDYESQEEKDGGRAVSVALRGAD